MLLIIFSVTFWSFVVYLSYVARLDVINDIFGASLYIPIIGENRYWLSPRVSCYNLFIAQLVIFLGQ